MKRIVLSLVLLVPVYLAAADAAAAPTVSAVSVSLAQRAEDQVVRLARNEHVQFGGAAAIVWHLNRTKGATACQRAGTRATVYGTEELLMRKNASVVSAVRAGLTAAVAEYSVHGAECLPVVGPKLADVFAKVPGSRDVLVSALHYGLNSFLPKVQQ